MPKDALRTLYMDSEEGELVVIAKMPMKDLIKIIKLAKKYENNSSKNSKRIS